MTIRLMCDSDNLANLLDTEVVATYADLIPTRAALAELQHRHSGQIVLIDRGLGDPLGRAVIFDVESGALGPGDMPGRFARYDPHGLGFLTVYGTPAKLAVVEQQLGHHNWWRWVAYWMNGLHAPDHPAAMIQFASDKELRAGVDLTLIHNPNWHPWKFI